MGLIVWLIEKDHMLERIRKEYEDKYHVKENQLKKMKIAKDISNKKDLTTKAVLNEYLANPLVGIGTQDLARIQRFK